MRIETPPRVRSQRKRHPTWRRSALFMSLCECVSASSDSGQLQHHWAVVTVIVRRLREDSQGRRPNLARCLITDCGVRTSRRGLRTESGFPQRGFPGRVAYSPNRLRAAQDRQPALMIRRARSRNETCRKLSNRTERSTFIQHGRPVGHGRGTRPATKAGQHVLLSLARVPAHRWSSG